MLSCHRERNKPQDHPVPFLSDVTIHQSHVTSSPATAQCCNQYSAHHTFTCCWWQWCHQSEEGVLKAGELQPIFYWKITMYICKPTKWQNITGWVGMWTLIPCTLRTIPNEQGVMRGLASYPAHWESFPRFTLDRLWRCEYSLLQMHGQSSVLRGGTHGMREMWDFVPKVDKIRVSSSSGR